MKKLLCFSCTVFFLLAISLTANATPLFVDHVTLSSGWSDVNKTYTDETQLCWAAATSAEMTSLSEMSPDRRAEMSPNRPPCCFLALGWLDWREQEESSEVRPDFIFPNKKAELSGSAFLLVGLKSFFCLG
jgi:hypothetical protein